MAHLLGLAIINGDAAGARKAVDGADVNAAVFNCYGTMCLGGDCTAAFVAARHGHTGFLGVLLAAPVSADPDKGDTGTGWTPLHAACANDHPDAVTVLLAHGADPNRVNKYGWTPCMVAAMWGRTACLRALAEGAARQEGQALDVNAVATRGPAAGMTVLDLALESVTTLGAATYLRDELGALRASLAPTLTEAASQQGQLQALRAEAESLKQQSERDARRAEALTRFLVSEVIRDLRPDRRRGRPISPRSILDHAATRVEATFADQPATAASIQLSLGESYDALGLHSQAVEQLKRAVKNRSDELGKSHGDTLAATSQLATALSDSWSRATPSISLEMSMPSPRLI